MSETRVPAGVPTGGQFVASARAESDVALGTDEGVADVATSLAYREVLQRWRADTEPAPQIQREVHALGRRLLAAAEEDRPGRDGLWMAVTAFEDNDEDGDKEFWTGKIAEACLTIGAKSSMKVADDGHGGHTRLFDMKPGQTCGDCGNGYATWAALAAHDCTGPVAAPDDLDESARDAVHAAAEHFASEINNAGKADQVGFLRRMRVGDEEILAALGDDDGLDDLVIDTASTVASAAYNDGGSADQVTADLESKRWLLAGDKTLVHKHPVALAAGECTDVVVRVDGTPITYRVSYSEWTPLGDNNQPAPGYLRGEFSAESEWAVHDHPVARESSPFRRDRGETAQVSYAWDQFSADLDRAAVTSVRKHQNDLVLRRIERD